MILLAKCFNSVKPLTLLSNPALPFSHDSSLQDSSKDSSKIPGDNDEGGRRGRGDNERRGEKKKNGDLSSSAHSAFLAALSCRERGRMDPYHSYTNQKQGRSTQYILGGFR